MMTCHDRNYVHGNGVGGIDLLIRELRVEERACDAQGTP